MMWMWQSHDLLGAFDHMASTSRTYLLKCERHWQEHLPPFAAAAVAFAVQLAIEAGYDVTTMRAMESDLIDRLLTKGAS